MKLHSQVASFAPSNPNGHLHHRFIFCEEFEEVIASRAIVQR